MSILKFLGLDGVLASRPDAAAAGDTDTVRRIVGALDRLEPERARYIASFAFILSRVARADLIISEPEVREMERIVMRVGGLTAEQAILVVQIAKTQAILFGGTENFLVTREFNKIATREDKQALLKCLFAVSASDDAVTLAEDNEIRRISNELDLTHAEFIEARSEFRDRLSILRPPPETGGEGGGQSGD